MFSLSALRSEHQHIVKVVQGMHVAAQGKAENMKKFIKAMEVEDPAKAEASKRGRRELWRDFSTGFKNIEVD